VHTQNTYRHQLERDADGTLTYLLLGDLRELLTERSAGPGTCTALLVILDALLEEIPRLTSLDAVGDEYLDQVLAECPHWTPQVDALRSAKIADYRQLAELRNVVAAQRSFAGLAEALLTDLVRWLSAFRTHRRRERRLVQMAVNIDVGGEA
jgi:hypothetical protein